jgi:hypothetical protein
MDFDSVISLYQDMKKYSSTEDPYPRLPPLPGMMVMLYL